MPPADAAAPTGDFLALFSPFSHLPYHNPENNGNQNQDDCQNQLHQHINLL
jgi:hypothetical protein